MSPFILLLTPCAAVELSREQMLALISNAGHQHLKLSIQDLSSLNLSGIGFNGADLFSANLDDYNLNSLKLTLANLNSGADMQ